MCSSVSPETRAAAGARVAATGVLECFLPVKTSPPPREIYASGGGLLIAPINAPRDLDQTNRSLVSRFTQLQHTHLGLYGI